MPRAAAWSRAAAGSAEAGPPCPAAPLQRVAAPQHVGTAPTAHSASPDQTGSKSLRATAPHRCQQSHTYSFACTRQPASMQTLSSIVYTTVHPFATQTANLCAECSLAGNRKGVRHFLRLAAGSRQGHGKLRHDRSRLLPCSYLNLIQWVYPKCPECPTPQLRSVSPGDGAHWRAAAESFKPAKYYSGSAKRSPMAKSPLKETRMCDPQVAVPLQLLPSPT